MIVILFCNLVCIRIHIRYVRISLADVVFFIVKSESKRSPRADFAAEDMKDNIRAIFVLIAVNFRISTRIARKRLKIQNFEIESNIHPILNSYWLVRKSNNCTCWAVQCGLQNWAASVLPYSTSRLQGGPRSEAVPQKQFSPAENSSRGWFWIL